MPWERFFLKNHTQNVLEKLVPDSFLKSYNWAYLWINGLKFYAVCFFFMTSWGLSNNVETKLRTTCFHVILLKIRGPELVSLPYFLYNFWKKQISCYTLLIDQIWLSGYLYFVRYWEICVLQLFANQVPTSWILMLALSF